MTERKQRSAKQAKRSEQREMSTLAKVVVDYCNFVEESAPIAIKALDDVYSVWFKAYRSAIDVETKLVQRLGVDSALTREGADVSNRVIGVMEEAQKIASTATLDTTLRISELIREAVQEQDRVVSDAAGTVGEENGTKST